MVGTLIISLDMELMWGVRSGQTREQYGRRILGERQAVPALLDTFERYGINATWATVGFAMCEGIDDLLARAPLNRPRYDDPKLSSYFYLKEVGVNERVDPYYFAPSLIRRIASCPGQEIGSHTFSHYYCLEPGNTLEQFTDDLDASIAILHDFGVECRSIVFPRNQYSSQHLDICRTRGVKVFRGNEDHWCYRPGNRKDQTMTRRAFRLVDSVLPLSGDHTCQLDGSVGITNVPASRFLRPYNRQFKVFDGLKLSRIERAMAGAARRGEMFHLWWHPHNFGLDLESNLAFLGQVLDAFRRLSDSHGMVSRTMGSMAQ
jgi:peptidoglycan/xylan/chitin deacetylase (PgdA/CDA1 family)